MKKILVFATQLMQTGGIESHILQFCEKMHSSNISISLVVLNTDVSADTKSRYLDCCSDVYFGKSSSSFNKILWLFKTMWSVRSKDFDVVYTNGQGESPRLFYKFLSKNIRWIHHHHTSGDAQDQATWSNGYRNTLSNASEIIACSQKNAASMSEVLKRKVRAIPCFSRKTSIQVKKKKQSDKIILGYFGRLIPEKGIDLLCKLSEDPLMSNVSFEIWGEGEAFPSSYFVNFPNIEYHGSFSGEKGLEEVLSTLDGLLLLSTHSEGLPICLLEAMSVGLPWLATDRGGISDIACDPNTTRLLSSVEDYHYVRKEIQRFAEAISNGNINRNIQIQFYEKCYSSDSLIARWSNVLQIT